MNRKITIEALSRPALTPVIFAMLLALIALYMYYLSVSVLHVVLRQEATHRVSVLTTEIAVLETEYINARHSISSRLATLTDYSDATEKIFLARETDSVIVFSDRPQ